MNDKFDRSPAARLRLSALGCFIVAALMAGQARANLIADGGFETPVTGSLGQYALGAAIGPWTVVGPGPCCSHPPMMIEATTYTEGGLSFQSQEGRQAIDLTGNANQGANGVQQTVATIPGVLYSLSFWIGHLDPTVSTLYSGSASATVVVQSTSLSLSNVFTNNNSSVVHGQTWTQFTETFTATDTSTSISFYNASLDGSIQNQVGLDNVVLSAAIPEPNGLAAVLVGIGAATMRRRRPR